ncbi:MAG: carboxymuconolactone decarboxylase family protein, partial [Terriglobales bacterium]
PAPGGASRGERRAEPWAPAREAARRMRISRLDKSQVDAESGALYDHYLQVRGNVPNMFRTVAHRPQILRTLVAHFRAVMETGTVPVKLKELVIVRTSQMNTCEY